MLHGMPGIGKTSLAPHAGRRLADRFPDGRIFLAGTGDPAVPLGRLLCGLGVAESRLPESFEDRVAPHRVLVRDKRVLLVLDDATSEAQVAPLSGRLTVITSRGPPSGS